MKRQLFSFCVVYSPSFIILYREFPPPPPKTQLPSSSPSSMNASTPSFRWNLNILYTLNQRTISAWSVIGKQLNLLKYKKMNVYLWFHAFEHVAGELNLYFWQYPPPPSYTPPQVTTSPSLLRNNSYLPSQLILRQSIKTEYSLL